MANEFRTEGIIIGAGTATKNGTEIETIGHKAKHENGGSDEISIAGLSGVAADPQTPVAHHAEHENGGSDEISIAGLSGEAADLQPPKLHASEHEASGSDEVHKPLPYQYVEIGAPFVTAGTNTWEDALSCVVTPVANASAIWTICTICLSTNVPGVGSLANIRAMIDGVAGQEIKRDLSGTSDHGSITVQFIHAPHNAGVAVTCKMQVKDEGGGKKLEVDHAQITAVALQI